jgi:hypothetical protein
MKQSGTVPRDSIICTRDVIQSQQIERDLLENNSTAPQRVLPPAGAAAAAAAAKYNAARTLPNAH